MKLSDKTVSKVHAVETLKSVDLNSKKHRISKRHRKRLVDPINPPDQFVLIGLHKSGDDPTIWYFYFW